MILPHSQALLLFLVLLFEFWIQPQSANPETSLTFDGYTYTSIELENGQHWMAENLRSSIYANGDSVFNPTDMTSLLALTTGAWLHYQNDPTNEIMYGKLYNWAAVSDPRNLCPSGWHVATDADWSALVEYLGGTEVAGAKLQTTDSKAWPYNYIGTDEIRFNGVPGGFVSSYGQPRFNNQFNQLNERGYWWTATQRDDNLAWYRALITDYEGIDRLSYIKANFLSVRCVED